jgi:hypothetical protein
MVLEDLISDGVELEQYGVYLILRFSVYSAWEELLLQ